MGAIPIEVFTGSLTRDLKLKSSSDSRRIGWRFATSCEAWLSSISVGFDGAGCVGGGFAAGIGLIPGVAVLILRGCCVANVNGDVAQKQ